MANLRGHGTLELDVRDRASSWLLRFAPWTNKAWTTINGVIYPPLALSAEQVAAHGSRYDSTLAHEAVHVRQQAGLSWPLFLLLYVLLPIPFLAPARAWFEAEAYAHEAEHYGRSADACVDAICSRLYVYPAPRWLVWWLMARFMQ